MLTGGSCDTNANLQTGNSLIENTLQSLRNIISNNRLQDYAENVCRNSLYEFLTQQQATLYNNAAKSTTLPITDLNLWESRHTIHFGPDTPPRFSVVFDATLLETSAFIDTHERSIGEHFPWPDSLSCELTLDLQPIQIRLGQEDGDVLFYKGYPHEHRIDQNWETLLCCLEKQAKNIELIGRGASTCIRTIARYGEYTEALEITLNECSLTLNRDLFENGYFITIWDIRHPSDDSITDTYLYWTDPFGAFLHESYDCSF